MIDHADANFDLKPDGSNGYGWGLIYTCSDCFYDTVNAYKNSFLIFHINDLNAFFHTFLYDKRSLNSSMIVPLMFRMRFCAFINFGNNGIVKRNLIFSMKKTVLH